MAKKKKKTEVLKKPVIIRPRHKLAIQKILENGGSEKDTLKALGYSEKYIQSGKIKSTKSWKAISEEELSNELLIQKNKWLLDFDKYGKRYWQAVASGLDKAYKARKIYTNGTHIEIDARDRQTLIESVKRRFERARR